MKLSTAKLCVSCEEIYEADACPVCASTIFLWLIVALGTIIPAVKKRYVLDASLARGKISPEP
jgi:hypothetical protein